MAVSFDGANTKLGGTILAMNSGDWTWIGWAYALGAGESNFGTLFLAETAGSATIQKFQFAGATRTLTAQQVGSTIATSTSVLTLSTSQWYCLAATFRASDGKCRIYTGDTTTAMSEVGSYSTQTTLATRTTGGTVFTIGNRNNQSLTWNGYLGPSALYQRELSLAEMEMFRASGKPASMQSLVGFWPLYGSYAAEPDLSGQGVTLTPTSAANALTNPPLPTRRLSRSRGLTRV